MRTSPVRALPVRPARLFLLAFPLAFFVHLVLAHWLENVAPRGLNVLPLRRGRC